MPVLTAHVLMVLHAHRQMVILCVLVPNSILEQIVKYVNEFKLLNFTNFNLTIFN